MSRVAGGFIGIGIFGVAFLPIAVLIEQASKTGYSLSGATSLFGQDQLQYLSWIRDEGLHIFARDDFALHVGGYVYVHPMFLISGLIWRAGASLAVSYFVWIPVAAVVLWYGFREFARYFLGDGLSGWIAVGLAALFAAPILPLEHWLGHPTYPVVNAAAELQAASLSPGYLPSALAVGLAPLFLLGVIQLSSPYAGDQQRWYGRPIVVAAIGLLVAWLHPWQGAILLFVLVLVVTLGRERVAIRPSMIAAVATAIPLAYYYLLSKSDVAWQIGQSQSSYRPELGIWLTALVPLLVFLPWARGPRGRRWTTDEQILWIWPCAAVLVLYTSTGYASHALEGMTLPLSVLSVRGFLATSLPRSLGIAGVILCVVPGTVIALTGLKRGLETDLPPSLLNPDEARALQFIGRSGATGGVLASLPIAPAVPAYTGRRTWVGHFVWTPHYGVRAETDTRFFASGYSQDQTRSLLRQLGVRFVLDDCGAQDRETALSRVMTVERRFGCVWVYRPTAT